MFKCCTVQLGSGVPLTQPVRQSRASTESKFRSSTLLNLNQLQLHALLVCVSLAVQQQHTTLNLATTRDARRSLLLLSIASVSQRRDMPSFSSVERLDCNSRLASTSTARHPKACLGTQARRQRVSETPAESSFFLTTIFKLIFNCCHSSLLLRPPHLLSFTTSPLPSIRMSFLHQNML